MYEKLAVDFIGIFHSSFNESVTYHIFSAWCIHTKNTKKNWTDKRIFCLRKRVQKISSLKRKGRRNFSIMRWWWMIQKSLLASEKVQCNFYFEDSCVCVCVYEHGCHLRDKTLHPKSSSLSFFTSNFFLSRTVQSKC